MSTDITVKQAAGWISSVGGAVAIIVSAAFFVDARHMEAAEVAELEAKIFAVNLQVARLTGVRALYLARQVDGVLTPGDAARLAQVNSEIETFESRSAQLQDQVAALR